MTADGVTSYERMIVAASRELVDTDVCLVGIGAPSAACNLARLTHAPGLVLIYESGTLETRPRFLPLSIGDGELCDTALTTVSVPELFRYWLQGGRITKGFLGGAQIDRFGNINTTVIGTYEHPTARLPGSGGAPEIASACQEVLITAQHSPRTFVSELDFVTSLGHGNGPDGRGSAGLSTRGPVAVITDMCIMRPHPGTAELQVTEIHADITIEQIRAATGWPIDIAEGATAGRPVTSTELEALRKFRNR